MWVECQVTGSGASGSAHPQQPEQQAWHPSLDQTLDSRLRIWAGLGPPEALCSGMQMAALPCGHTCSSFSHVCILISCSHQDPYYMALGSCHQTQSHSHSLGVRAETYGLWGQC